MELLALDPKFFSLFDLYLGEQIDLNDLKSVEHNAVAVALEIKHEQIDEADVVIQLKNLLHDWTKANIIRFSEKTEIDWSFSASDTDALKLALQRIVDTLEPFPRR